MSSHSQKRLPQSSSGLKFHKRSIVRTISRGLSIVAVVAVFAHPLSNLAEPQQAVHATAPQLLFTSIDTMKESMDTDSYPLNDAQIADDVNLAASLHPSYITVDTHYDYPAYMQRWVNAVRATGKHVWFRIHPNQWEDSNGTTGIMTPAAYEAAEQSFISANPSLFRPGDILDPCPEPENGLYWKSTYGSSWTANAPNAATDAFNAFIQATTTIADTALHNAGIYGVITTVRSTNSWFARTPNALYPATVSLLGRVTIDSYPDATTTDPATAATSRTTELAGIESVRGVPIVIGEMGYSNKLVVDDQTQDAVLKAEFSAMGTVPYLSGVNYWVGAGTNNSGGYTHVFNGSTGAWTPRPSAADLSSFYAAYGAGGQPIPSVTPTATNTPQPSATNTPQPSATNTPQPSATNTPQPSATNAPQPAWASADIGNVGVAGSQALSGATWTVQGAGADIYGSADAFHFVWQTLGGDGTVSAHITSQTNTNAWAKAGVMLRAGTSPGAPFYAALVTPGNGFFVEYRIAQGGSVTRGTKVTGAVPLYLKITRAGSTFSSYSSADGSTWTLIPSSTKTMNLPTTVLDGVAVTAHSVGALSTVTFEAVTL